MIKSNFYVQAIGNLRKELTEVIGQEATERASRREALAGTTSCSRARWLLLGLGFWLAASFDQPWLWIPGAMIAGLTIFNFTVFLHEVVHQCVHRKPSKLTQKILGYMYAMPSGISSAQFDQWHMDHHRELGTPDDDPKRHYLSPKINARWYKALYCTPFLIPLYFRAARREMAIYPEELREQDPLPARLDHRRPPRSGGHALGALRPLDHVQGVRDSLPAGLPGGLHGQPPGTALRHRSERSGEVEHADEGESRLRTSPSATRTITSSTTTSSACPSTTCASCTSL